jgi:hypothetical protein
MCDILVEHDAIQHLLNLSHRNLLDHSISLDIHGLHSPVILGNATWSDGNTRLYCMECTSDPHIVVPAVVEIMFQKQRRSQSVSGCGALNGDCTLMVRRAKATAIVTAKHNSCTTYAWYTQA